MILMMSMSKETFHSSLFFIQTLTIFGGLMCLYVDILAFGRPNSRRDSVRISCCRITLANRNKVFIQQAHTVV